MVRNVLQVLLITEAEVLMYLVTQAHTSVIFLESLRQMEINYCHFNNIGPNEHDQECHECPLSVFFKKIGVLMDSPLQASHMLQFYNSWVKDKPNIAILVNLTPIVMIRMVWNVI